MTTVTRRDHTIDGSVMALACLAVAFLLWQGAEYIGLIERLGEWQFGVVDRYWPTLTPTVLVLFALIVIGLGALLWRRRRARRDASIITPMAQYQRALIGETRLLRATTILAVIGVASALFCFLSARAVTDAGPVREVDVRATAMPPEGPARLVGRVDTTHIAVLSRSVLFARHDLFVAPVVGAAGPVRYLVELERIETPRERWYAPRQGLLRQFPTARELAPLYRDIGIVLNEQPYVLLRSADTLRWAWKAAAAQSVVFALVAGCFAMIFRRRRKRLTENLPPRETIVA